MPLDSKQKPSKKQILQALWRKAFREGEVRVPTSSGREAARFRFELYGAVRAVKAGQEGDEELRAAALDCTVRAEGSEVVLENSSKLTAYNAALSLLELEDLQPETPTRQEMDAAGSLDRVLQKLAEEESPRPATPYFTREG